MLLFVIASSSPPEWIIKNVMRWQPIVETYTDEYPYVTQELVLGVIAKESRGIPYVQDTALAYDDGWGAVGLMQIIPFSWRPERAWLKIPENNIQYGVLILNQVVREHGVRKGLAVYNCGLVGVEANRCGRFGGYTYADEIMNYWMPEFKRELITKELGDLWNRLFRHRRFYPL
jgi:soluble lytic murein transglycosylase-like protein